MRTGWGVSDLSILVPSQAGIEVEDVISILYFPHRIVEHNIPCCFACTIYLLCIPRLIRCQYLTTSDSINEKAMYSVSVFTVVFKA